MMEASKDNTRVNVNFALNYGGREEIVRAMQKTMGNVLRLSGSSHRSRSAQDDKLSIDSLESLSKNELKEMLESSMDTVGIPDPDMIIRPGGEKRLSGFMLWQSEYSELYFTDVLMPDLLHIKGYNAAKRSVFIIMEDGKIGYKWVSEDPLKEPNYEEIKNFLK